MRFFEKILRLSFIFITFGLLQSCIESSSNFKYFPEFEENAKHQNDDAKNSAQGSRIVHSSGAQDSQQNNNEGSFEPNTPRQFEIIAPDPQENIEHQCELNNNDQVVCSGFNRFGEMGEIVDNSAEEAQLKRQENVILELGNEFEPIAIETVSENDFADTCILFETGLVKCLGSGRFHRMNQHEQESEDIPFIEAPFPVEKIELDSNGLCLLGTVEAEEYCIDR